MSEGIVEALKKIPTLSEIEHINHVIHNRSDYFLNCFVKKSQDPIQPEYVLSKVDKLSSLEFPGKNLKEEANFYLDNQSLNKIGKNRVDARVSAIDNINKTSVDVFLLDNFMDVASMLVHEKDSNNEYFVFSGAFESDTFNKLYQWTAYLSESESLDNWIQIIHWLRLKQPEAKIFFTPFPRNVFNHEAKPSVLRARSFKDILNINNFPATILNSSDVDLDAMTSIEDWCHYKPSYYKVLAEEISLFLTTK